MVSKTKNGFSIILTSDVLHKDMFLFLKGKGHFSDNFFDLLPNEEMTIEFKTDATYLNDLKIVSCKASQGIHEVNKIEMDISTVSRVANSKYVDTPYGTKLIKEYFSESMKNDQGEDVSTLEIKNILKNIIEEEDKNKPLPDDQLAEILKEKGYPIARRTIAKYRDLLDIPVARMRKKI